MRYPQVKLNARQIGTAKGKEKPYKLADGGGLYLLVKVTDKKIVHHGQINIVISLYQAELLQPPQ